MMQRAKDVLYRGLALLLGVLALAAFSAAYFSPAKSICRIVLVGLAGVFLLGIDLVIRGVIVEKPWYRRLLPIWCLVPFGLAFFVGAAQHYQIREDALNDTERLASEVLAALQTPGAPSGTTRESTAEAPVKHYTTDALTKVVKQLEDARRETSLGDEETQRFNALVRTVANDLNGRGLDAARVRADAGADTFAEFLLALAVQGLFVFWVPCLLAVAIRRAGVAVEQGAGSEFTPNGVKRSIRTRDENILGEKRPLFVPRLCFAILMLLGTNYIFAPLGLKTTYMMTIVDQHAAPGQTSFTLWSTSFSQSPVITAGFLGFLLYAVITSTQRFAQDDFDDQAMFSLLVRGLVVILLSFALSASPVNEQISRTFVFVAGVFPVRALEALGKKLSITLDPDFSPSENGSFEGLPSLDPTKAFALRAAGIQSTADLAAMEINSIAERVWINPRLLGRTVDRAILIDAVGMKIVGQLEECGVRLATEIAVPEAEIPGPVIEKLGDMARMIARRLARDPRVEAVRQWRTNTSDATAIAEVVQKVALSNRVKRLIEAGDNAGAANEFITIDLSTFGPLAPLHLLYSDFSQVDQLIEGVCSQFPSFGTIERFQYGKQWELRADPAAPKSAVPHARVDLQLWGVPVPDHTPLADRGIKRGATLYAVSLTDAPASPLGASRGP